MKNYLDNCPCGSGECAFATYDNHNIFVFYSCDACDENQRLGYDPVIFNDYEAYEEKVIQSGESFQ